ncbi:epoxide hydrolase family protein, partial [Rhizobium ruizarguesonis]
MKKFDNILAWRRLVRGAMVMAVGSMLLFPAGYLVPASAADVTSDGPATPIEADETIRPFQIHVPQSQLDDLRKRIAETRWPDKETVSDASQGIQLSRVQDLVRYWGTDYDWRKAEAELNALPEFITTIDGVDIQFIHVRSRHPNALPVILTHGWPGSTFEFIKAIGPLTDPTAYGGKAEDAFYVVIPSIPGYGFSGKPTELGWGPDRVARAWD